MGRVATIGGVADFGLIRGRGGVAQDGIELHPVVRASTRPMRTGTGRGALPLADPLQLGTRSLDQVLERDEEFRIDRVISGVECVDRRQARRVEDREHRCFLTRVGHSS